MPNITFELPATLQALVKRLSLKPADFEPALPAAAFLRGSLFFSDDGINPEILNKCGHWFYQERWSDGYREVYVDFAQRAIFTCCEGDLDLTVDDSAEAFEARLVLAAAFYGAEVRRA